MNTYKLKLTKKHREKIKIERLMNKVINDNIDVLKELAKH